MQIKLRDLKPRDEVYFFEWLKDKDLVKFSSSIFQELNSKNKISEWFNKLLVDNSYKKAIVNLENDEFIGYAGICNLSRVNLSGEYFIFIGNRDYHKKGIGTIVTKKIIDNGFRILNLNRLMLTVSAENYGTCKVYEKSNFIKEGVMREAFYRDGKFIDKILMSILRSDWETYNITNRDR
ncbi:MAG: GNAT family N-acetyltransferase [Sarcina sp.]